jgi:superfamily II DNA/RNA helicase
MVCRTGSGKTAAYGLAALQSILVAKQDKPKGASAFAVV